MFRVTVCHTYSVTQYTCFLQGNTVQIPLLNNAFLTIATSSTNAVTKKKITQVQFYKRSRLLYFCLIYDAAGPLCQRYLKQTPLLNSGQNGARDEKKTFCQFFRKTTQNLKSFIA